jgi:hypothetical protein
MRWGTQGESGVKRRTTPKHVLDAFSPLLPQFIAAHRRRDDEHAASVRDEWSQLEAELGHVVLPLEVYAHLLGAVQRDMAGAPGSTAVPVGITPPTRQTPEPRRRRAGRQVTGPRLRGPDGRWKARST